MKEKVEGTYVFTPRLAGHQSNARSMCSFSVLENKREQKKGRSWIGLEPQSTQKKKQRRENKSQWYQGYDRKEKERKESNHWELLKEGTSKTRTWPPCSLTRDVKRSHKVVSLVLPVRESGIWVTSRAVWTQDLGAWELLGVRARARWTSSAAVT